MEVLSCRLLWLFLKASPGETEVCKHWDTLAVDEDVSRLQVPMHDVAGVHEVNRTEQVVENGYDVHLGQLEIIGIFYQLSQVLLDVVHHQHDALILTHRGTAPLLVF